jgi:hypothetical protein
MLDPAAIHVWHVTPASPAAVIAPKRRYAMNRVEAFSLLEWLEEELQILPPGVDPMRLREIQALCARLVDAPGPPEAIHEQAATVARWSRVLLSAREHWRYDRPGHPGYEEARSRALEAVSALRFLIHHGDGQPEKVAESTAGDSTTRSA